MIHPTRSDIGRSVRHRIVQADKTGAWITGRITDLTDAAVFVKFEGEATPKPKNRVDLEFVE